MGIYGLLWTPGIIYEVFTTPQTNFKNLYFSHKTPQCLALPRPSIHFWDPRGYTLEQRALWPQIQKSVLFSHNVKMGVFGLAFL